MLLTIQVQKCGVALSGKKLLETNNNNDNNNGNYQLAMLLMGYPLMAMIHLITSQGM